MNLTIRAGRKGDLSEVYKLIEELAIYEKSENELINTIENMEQDGFGPNPAYELIVAEVDKKLVGLALYYYIYSTWKGRSLYLEDLIVTQKYRKQGIGKLLFNKVVEKAKQMKVGRFSWQVLDWNRPAIEFYKNYPTAFDEGWINCTITKKDLEKL